MNKNIFLIITIMASMASFMIHNSQASQRDVKTRIEKAAAAQTHKEGTLTKVYIKFMDMVVPMDRDGFKLYCKAFDNNQNKGNKAFNVFLPALNACQLLTDQEFKEWCDKQPSKKTLVRFYDSHTKISNRELSYYDLQIYKRAKQAQSKKTFTLTNEDSSIEIITEKEHAEYRKINPKTVLVRFYECHEPANTIFTADQFEKYKKAKDAQNGNNKCHLLHHRDGSVELMLDDEYATRIALRSNTRKIK